VVFGLTSAGAALLPAVSFLNYGGPSSALCFVLGDATLLVAFLDVLGHPLLLVGVTRFISTGHGNLHLRPLFPFDHSIVPTKSREGLSYDQETSRYRLVCLVRPAHHDHQRAIWQRSSEDRYCEDAMRRTKPA
jgi:hypothetical protein